MSNCLRGIAWDWFFNPEELKWRPGFYRAQSTPKVSSLIIKILLRSCWPPKNWNWPLVVNIDHFGKLWFRWTYRSYCIFGIFRDLVLGIQTFSKALRPCSTPPKMCRNPLRRSRRKWDLKTIFVDSSSASTSKTRYILPLRRKRFRNMGLGRCEAVHFAHPCSARISDTGSYRELLWNAFECRHPNVELKKISPVAPGVSDFQSRQAGPDWKSVEPNATGPIFFDIYN